MVPILNRLKSFTVLSHSAMFSPPQNCLKTVALIIRFIGKLSFSAKSVIAFPKLTTQLKDINLKSQYERTKSLSVLPENETFVLLNESIFSDFIDHKDKKKRASIPSPKMIEVISYIPLSYYIIGRK